MLSVFIMCCTGVGGDARGVVGEIDVGIVNGFSIEGVPIDDVDGVPTDGGVHIGEEVPIDVDGVPLLMLMMVLPMVIVLPMIMALVLIVVDLPMIMALVLMMLSAIVLLLLPLLLMSPVLLTAQVLQMANMLQ